MRRWTLKITLSLLAGAVVTWGVAWGCALWGPDPAYLGPQGRPAHGRAPGTWGGAPGVELHRSAVLTRWAYLREGRGAFVVEAGWPMRAAWTSWAPEDYDWRRPWTGAYLPQRVPDGLIAALRPRGTMTLVPTRVLPLGFVINTLLAAGMLLGLVEGVAFARRRTRHNKGRCPACGYDRGGLAAGAACPECGGAA